MGLFEKHMTKKAKFKKHLLIVNRHNNYVNICFIEACNE